MGKGETRKQENIDERVDGISKRNRERWKTKRKKNRKKGVH